MNRPAAALLLAATTALIGGSGTQRGGEHSRARLAQTLAGLKAGEPRRCIHPDQFNDLRTFDGAILYVAGKDRMYRNDVQGSCPGLKRGDTVITQTLTSDLCEGDFVRTRAAPGGQLSGSCALGRFTPFTR